MRDEFEQLAQRSESQYFYKAHVENAGEHHVAWIDIMGILDHLKKGQLQPAIARGELLSVVSQHIDQERVQVTTVGDGVIILTEDRNYLEDFLDALMRHYVRFNVRNWKDGGDIWLNRLLRVGVGKGDIHLINRSRYAGMNKNGDVFHDDFRNEPFGPGMIRAMQSERGAPFSIHTNTGSQIEPYCWWEEVGLAEESRKEIIEMLISYFDWYDAKSRYRYEPYTVGHLEDALEYFDVEDIEEEE